MDKNKLIVALDVNKNEVCDYVDKLKDFTWGFKVGLRLFVETGPSIIWLLKAKGCKVFLDLKFFDIPNTVYSAVKELMQYQINVDMFNVHILGTTNMLKKVSGFINQLSNRPLILGVTLLTSIDTEILANELQIPINLEDYVVHLAKLAEESNLDGVIASPREISILRKTFGPNFKIITPGIRMPDSLPDDQKRTLTPYEAIKAGADAIVVGRPIIKAQDPVKAAVNILADMKRAEYEKEETQKGENIN